MIKININLVNSLGCTIATRVAVVDEGQDEGDVLRQHFVVISQEWTFALGDTVQIEEV